MGRGRSGRTGVFAMDASARRSRVPDSDYDAGGSGLLGSRLFNDREEADDLFGVSYVDDDYYGDFDRDVDGAFNDWFNSINNDELNGPVKYTGSSYTTINKYLREGTLDSAPDWVKEAVLSTDTSMQKFYLPQAITVWRGGSNKLIGGAATVEQINAMAGTVVVDRGITSTAVTKEHAWTGGTKMGYEIVYPKGYGRGIYIDPVSQNHGEQEFMGARNTRYQVLGGYTDEDGRVICRLKAIY